MKFRINIWRLINKTFMHYLCSPLINIGQPKLIKGVGLFLGQAYYYKR